MISFCFLAFLAIQLVGSSAKSVTYPGIGTFTDHDFFDIIHRPFVMLPQSPEHIDPTFALYTRRNLNEEDDLVYNDPSKYKESHFDPKHQTKVIVHGFIDNRLFGEWMNEMKNQFLEKDDYNVIIVDWHKGNFFPYTQATANTRVVGPMIGILIQNLCKTFNTTAGSFHLLGHSLGSHVVGYAGKFLKGEVGHITGLDPAGPYYEGIVPEGRLWHTDAKFVEAIHTDARHLIPYIGFGMYETCAHVDIFPNGGKIQPGCDQERFTSILIKGLFEGARRIVACNHQRAVDFYIDSINNIGASPVAYECADYADFEAGKCHDCGADGSKCVVLGPQTEESKNVKITTQGKRFFMSTMEHKPFLKYQYYINIQMDPAWQNVLSESGRITLKFVNTDGNTESFDFKRNGDMLHLIDHTYRQVHVLDTNPDKLANIEFEWSHGLIDIIFHGKMYVNHIDLIPLNLPLADGKTKTPKSIRFVPAKHGIPNDEDVVFRPSQ